MKEVKDRRERGCSHDEGLPVQNTTKEGTLEEDEKEEEERVRRKLQGDYVTKNERDS